MYTQIFNIIVRFFIKMLVSKSPVILWKFTVSLRSVRISYLFIFSCSALAIAEASKESYQDEDSVCGSMLSLAHSNSSTSFPEQSL